MRSLGFCCFRVCLFPDQLLSFSCVFWVWRVIARECRYQSLESVFAESGDFFVLTSDIGHVYYFSTSLEGAKQTNDFDEVVPEEQFFARDAATLTADASLNVIDEAMQMRPHLIPSGPLCDFDLAPIPDVASRISTITHNLSLQHNLFGMRESFQHQQHRLRDLSLEWYTTVSMAWTSARIEALRPQSRPSVVLAPVPVSPSPKSDKTGGTNDKAKTSAADSARARLARYQARRLATVQVVNIDGDQPAEREEDFDDDAHDDDDCM
jgi:hypothetical protein